MQTAAHQITKKSVVEECFLAKQWNEKLKWGVIEIMNDE